jgi:hypothetical protein
MKKLLLVIVANLIACAVFSQKTKLPEGTPLKVKLVKELSSKTAEVGDILNFTVVECVKVDGKILIDSNAKVTGEVIEVQKARSLGRPGKLNFTINNTKSVDDQNISLRTTTKKMEGKNNTGDAVAAAIIFTPIILLIKGKDIQVPKDKEFLVYIDKEYEIEVK